MSQRPDMSRASQAGPARSGQASRLSHLHLFAIGWTYYLLIPILAGRLGLFESSDAFALMDRFCSPHDPWWPALISYAALLPVVFGLGSLAARRLPRAPAMATPLRQPTRILLPLYAVALLVTGYAARGNLFAGYSDDMDLSVVGPVATLQMCMLLQYLATKDARLPSSRWIGWLLVVSSILLIGMGGRLYVLSALVAVYFYWWKYTASGRRARRNSLAMLIAVPLLFSLVGMWRLGVFDVSQLGFYLFAEPLFTSISAFTLMSGRGWAMIDSPLDFLSAFFNIVPASIWPDKVNTVISLVDTPLQFQAPFGAISIVTSTIGNFGYLGGLAFVALVGFIMERVRRASGTPGGRALYCYLCCLLPFMFFRDPFQVQVKVVLTGFILIWINRLLALARPRRQAPSGS